MGVELFNFLVGAVSNISYDLKESMGKFWLLEEIGRVSEVVDGRN